MSGGVDSSVAAALLLRQGYDVVGAFMRLGSPGESLGTLTPSGDTACTAARGPGPTKIGHQGCCSISDASDARLVAARLGIPFYVCNFKREFGRIMDYFADEYRSGRTPNPCVRCNDWLKFGRLHEYADQIGARYVASGHYARIADDGRGGRSLLRGIDADKDQSYVLFGISPERLARTLFPVGGHRKDEIRRLAREFELPVFDKPDSQEICFVPDQDYASFVERHAGFSGEPGDLVDGSGAVLGRHAGHHRFTIGQRRGVGVALGYPVYVVEKNVGSNRVVLGPRAALARTRCHAAEANWLVDPAGIASTDGWIPCLAQHRYNSDAVPACARAAPSGVDSGARSNVPSGRAGEFEVRFEQPQEAVTPGQAIVLYDRVNSDLVLGGGWIRSAD
ncbi:MAG: tRNA 2-thiouridine(34) synthase MnmA [Phycisphaerae bacterium]|nr:tRNA 2-thiouridine(34) synthase MnmA [Phycisphaerae bacterium]